MAGGGKTATSSSSVQIPPEVLARYNSVNAQAQTAANQPFQQYSTNPSAFVAPLNSTQQAAIANTNAYSGAAQPYYGAASQALGAGVNAAVPLVGQSAGTIGQAQDIGNAYNQAAAQGYATAPGAADPYNQAASASYGAGLAAGMPMNAMSAQMSDRPSNKAPQPILLPLVSMGRLNRLCRHTIRRLVRLMVQVLPLPLRSPWLAGRR